MLCEWAGVEVSELDQHLGGPVEGTRVLQDRLDPDTRDEVVQPGALDLGFGTSGQRRFCNSALDVSLFLFVRCCDQGIKVTGFRATLAVGLRKLPNFFSWLRGYPCRKSHSTGGCPADAPRAPYQPQGCSG